MNRKQFIILLILVVIIGGGGLLIRQRSHDSWENSATTLGGKLLPNFPVNDIAQITIQSGTNEVHLIRADNLWRVRERGNYPANFSQISDWIIKLSDLKVAQSQDIGPSQLGRFDLLPPGPATNTATLVEFADASGKTLDSLLLGKKHMKKSASPSPAGMGMDDAGWPDGRYVMVGNNTTTLDVISDALDNSEPNPDQWLNKDFLDVQKPGAIAVQYPVATNSWKLTRASETNDWQLADAGPKEKLDSSKASGVTSPFSSASFSDVLPPDTKPEISGLTNTTTVTVNTLDGFTYAAQIGQKQSDNYPVTFALSATFAPAAKPADQKILADKLAKEQACQHWIYLIPTYVIDPLLKPRSDLLVVETNSPAVTNTPTGGK